MTALVDRSKNSTAVANTNVGDPFGAGTENMPGATTYMKFKGASGQFLAGSDEEEIDHGSQYAANIFDSMWIWTFWWDGKVIETEEHLLRENPMAYDHMPDYLPDDDDIDMTLDEIKKMQKEDPANFRDGWSVQASIGLRPVDGTDEEFTLRLGGSVALRAFHALRRAYSRQYKLREGLIPVVELAADGYKSKIAGVGRRYAPTIKIIDWASEEDLMAAAGEDEGDYGDMDPTPEPEKKKAAPKQIESAKEVEEDEVPETDEADEAEVVEETQAPAGRRGARGRKFGNK
jgi:hypothetical protein